jgi:hypothetical protein
MATFGEFQNHMIKIADKYGRYPSFTVSAESGFFSLAVDSPHPDISSFYEDTTSGNDEETVYSNAIRHFN